MEEIVTKRLMVAFVIAIFTIGLLPAAAGAQTEEEVIAAVAEVRAAAGELATAVSGGDPVDIQAKADALRAAVDALKVVAPDVDYGGLDDALDALDAAITGGDAAEIAAAADAVAAAAEAAAAEAEAGAEGEGEGGSAPSGGVDTGAGGTAEGTGLPIGLLLAALLGLVAAAGLYGRTRRSQG
jgi:hypothetical protein